MRYAAGIFCIAASTLLLEISLSRIFSVLFFHHFAFLIISTALFGFGFSGVYLFFRKPSAEKLDQYLGIAAILFGLTTLIIYRILLVMPAQSDELMQRPELIVRLLFNYLLLAIPFYFSGYVVSAILTSFSEQSGKLYAYDLIGAALGCLSVLWLIPAVGGSGAVVLASLIAGISAMIFARRHKFVFLCAAGFVIVCLLLIYQSEKVFPFPIKGIVESKYPGRQVRTEKPEYSAWSPISRIDVYPTTSANKIMLLDGGSNVSLMTPFDGNISALKPRYNWRVVPFVISHRSTACIIGPGGGEDVLNALSFQTESIDAVEMDPLIVKLVQGRYRDFIGEVFNQPGVNTVNDEGRSFLRRSQKQYDLIQQVHNISPIAIASGALNLSESYLLTKEAFQEYWDHLEPEGMLAINRWGVVRAASIASQVLEKNGVHDPENYALVTSRQKSGTDISFYLKKGRINQNDLKQLMEFSNALGIRIDYAPHPDYQTNKNVYYRLLAIESRDAFIKQADIDLSAPTDDRPFFDHIQKLGSFPQSSSVVPNELNRVLRFLNRGDMALFTLLGEAAVLSSLFILLPVIRFGKRGSAISRWSILAYFSALGLGFILIEISLIQKHILFLGQPVYSISSVLFSVLLSAGIGSYLFQRCFRDGSERLWLVLIPVLLGTLLLVELLIMPFIFHLFLGSSKVIRFCISAILIAPLGFFLGIPFPLGIRILGMRAPEIIPWGWALNAYATVIGSILAVMFAILLGFRMNFAIAFLAYTIGFIFLRSSLSSRAMENRY
jgi:spermidine synthase